MRQIQNNKKIIMTRKKCLFADEILYSAKNVTKILMELRGYNL